MGAEILALIRDQVERIGEEAASVAEARVADAEAKAAAELERVLDQIAATTRRIRAATDASAALKELGDSAAQFCDRSIVLLNDGDRLTGFHSSGAGAHPSPAEMAQITFELSAAPALAHAVETKDAVVIKGSQHNVSHKLASRFAFEQDLDLIAFPLVLRDTVLGVLLADGDSKQASVIEALVLTAEAWIEALGSRPNT